MSKHTLFYTLLFIFIGIQTGCGDYAKRPITQWQHAVDGSYSADISDDNQFALVSTIHHGLGLWDLKQHQLLYQWQHSQSENHQVFAVKIAPNNHYALSAGRTDFVIWDLKTGKANGYWKIEQSTIRDIAISANGEQVLAGLGDGTVVHINVATGRRLEFLGHTEKINSVALSANGRFALSGGNDFNAFLWDTQTGQVIYQFTHTSRVSKVALEKDGRFAFSADSKKSAIIWDLATGQQHSQLHFRSRQQIFSSVDFENQGKLLITGAPSRKVALWDTDSGQQLQKWMVTPSKNSRPGGAVVYDARLYNSNTIITSSSSGLTELWQINTHN